MMKPLNKRLWRMIKQTRGQFLAIVAIVSIGIFTYTALSNAAINLDNTLKDYYQNNHFADAFLDLVSLDEQQVQKLLTDPDISTAKGRVVLDVPMLTEDTKRVTARLVSIDGEESPLNELTMIEGERSITGNEAIVISQFAQGRQIQLGETLSVQVEGRVQTVVVKGIASSPEYVYLMENGQAILPIPDQFGVIYLEKDYLQQISGYSGRVNNLILSLQDPALAEEKVDQLKEQLKSAGVYSAVARADQLSNSMISMEIESLQKMSGTLPLVFLCFSGLMLITLLGRTIKGDRTTIGVLKALGYTNGEIIGHYSAYALLAGVLGGILGNIIGISMAGGMTRLYIMYFNMPEYTIRFYPDKVFWAMLLTCCFALGSGHYSCKSVLKITPADAMRPEPPKQGKRLWLDHWPRLWSALTFSWKMVIRTMAREKKKCALVILAVAMTFSMLLMTFWFNDVFKAMIQTQYSSFMTMDYTVGLTHFQDQSVVKDLQKYLDTEEIEGKLEIPCDISFGPKVKTISVVGLMPDTRFYNLLDRQERPIALKDEGIILSSNLAKSLGVQVGDQVYVESLMADKASHYFPVLGINEQALGINAYLTLPTMGQIFADKNTINGFYLKSSENLTTTFQEMDAIASVSSQKEMKASFDEFLGLMVLMIGFLVIFSGVLGFAIIYSTTMMSIGEREGEFSSLRVLGYRQKEVFRLLLKENMLLTWLGLLLGLPLGYGLIVLMGQAFASDLYTLNQPISFPSLLWAFLMSWIFILLAQLATYRKIKEMDFIQALKSRIS